MALEIRDRVKETCTGTNADMALTGAVSGFVGFDLDATLDGDTIYYALEDADGTKWEVGLGTLSGDSTTIARTTILATQVSFTDTTRQTFSGGAHTIFGTYPAGKAVYLDASGNLSHTVDISTDTNLAAGTGITLTGDSLSTTDGDIVHDNLSGFVANEHIDHTSVTLTAGTGLSGGGTIAANRTFNVDINGTADLTAPAVADELLISDADDSNTVKKADLASIVNLADHDALTNFVANEHLDWTASVGTIHAGNYTNTTYTKASFDLDHLFTLVDASADTSENLGTFTGSTISDSVTIKAALQALETTVETKTSNTGDITGVTAGTGLTGGGSSGGVTLTVDITGTGDLTAPAVADELLISDANDSNTVKKADLASIVNLADHDALTNFVANEHLDWTASVGTIHAGNYTDTTTNTMGSGFVLEDGDGTEVTITENKEVKFIEGAGIDIDWTDTDNGTDADPYDLTFTVDHDAASNFVANEHIDHSAVSISSGTGLSGGGTIASTRTLAVDINGTADLASPAVGDELLISDADDSNTVKKADLASIVNLADHDALTNFVANEHLDWTASVGTIHAGNYTDTTYTKASFDLDHLFTLVDATADTSEHLGTFTGSTISDSVTIKAALQALETAVETKGVTAGSSSIVTVGALDSGSITSGFGTIATGDTISGSTITASTALKTLLIEYTDGDDAITIHDGGAVTFAKSINQAIANAEAEPENAVIDIDLRKGNYFEVTLGATVTDIDFTYGTDGQRFVIRFEQAAGANYTMGAGDGWDAVTHDQDGGGSPAAVTMRWAGGTAPTMTATNAKADTYGFIVRDENKFDGYVIGQNV